MEIKTIEQIKEGLAKHYGYSYWLDMLSNSGDWSHDRYINEIAKEYASQFQTNTDLITTEICVLRERIAELEEYLIKSNEIIKILDSANSDMLNEVRMSTKCPDNRSFVFFNEEIESLINKGKQP